MMVLHCFSDRCSWE